MFSFIKMKFKTYMQVRSNFCKEKTKSIFHHGKISQTSQTHQEDKRDQGDLRFLRLLISESLQRPNENRSRHAKLLENHLKQKCQWNSLTRDF